MRTRKVIRSIAVKEFRHILRDPVSCLLLFLMPVIILVIFGYALSFELNHVNIAVLSRDRSVSSEKLFLRLDANRKSGSSSVSTICKILKRPSLPGTSAPWSGKARRD